MEKILEHKYAGGDYYKAFASRLCVHIENGDNFTDEHHRVMLTRDEAIAAARAILKHFNCGMED